MAAERKQVYFSKLTTLLEKYPKIMVVGCDNVGSKHMQDIRRNLRGKAELLMGKNTMIRKAIKGHLSKNPGLESLMNHIKGNVGFVFTNGDLKDIRDDVDKNKVAASARIGAIAPCDVFVPAGNTGLDPSFTGFMQALNIATRINKGQIEIINDIHLIKKGEKVGSSESALLQKLNINPFFYGLIPTVVYDSGSVFSPNVLDITNDEILKKFTFGVQRMAALSLQINYPTITAIPHYFGRAYGHIVGIALGTDYSFDRVASLKALLADPEALAAAAAAQAASSSAVEETVTESASSKKAEEKPAEKPAEEEEEEVGFGDLFG